MAASAILVCHTFRQSDSSQVRTLPESFRARWAGGSPSFLRVFLLPPGASLPESQQRLLVVQSPVALAIVRAAGRRLRARRPATPLARSVGRSRPVCPRPSGDEWPATAGPRRRARRPRGSPRGSRPRPSPVRQRPRPGRGARRAGPPGALPRARRRSPVAAPAPRTAASRGPARPPLRRSRTRSRASSSENPRLIHAFACSSEPRAGMAAAVQRDRMVGRSNSGRLVARIQRKCSPGSSSDLSRALAPSTPSSPARRIRATRRALS